MKANASSSARAEAPPLSFSLFLVLVLLVASSVVGSGPSPSSYCSSSSSRHLAAAFLASPPPTTAPGGWGGGKPPRTRTRTSTTTTAAMTTTALALLPRTRATVAEMEAESEVLRGEINGMRAEALRRLEDLRERLLDAGTMTMTTTTASSPESSTKPRGSALAEFLDSSADSPAPPPVATSSNKVESLFSGGDDAASADPLDGTRWKVSLSVGREPGTWMPPDWGKSGKRINVSFVAEFAPSLSRERDDLLLRGGRAGGDGANPAKVLRVVDGIATLGPSTTVGSRVYAARDGGWRVARGEGPAGTDLLRFYVDVDGRMAHDDDGCDVYVPGGRVYCSCGYFPFATGGSGGGGSSTSSSSYGATTRESLVEEMRIIAERVTRLRRKKDGIRNPFDLDGIRISREISRLKREAGVVNYKLNFAAAKEPDKRLLRFSKYGDVGLTKEGGVCCQVNKGPMVEYHILGRFSIASVDRD